MLKVGIQGGPGSFNDEAARTHLPGILQDEFEIVYLYTTPNVLDALQEHRIDRGQFAIHNSLGGDVQESKDALDNVRDTFDVIAEYSLLIRHALLAALDADVNTIDTIMGHPQALAQCKAMLANRFAHMHCISGKGNLADPAAVADAIAQEGLPASTAVLGSTALAAHFGLQILERDLQDAADNRTTFVLVKS